MNPTRIDRCEYKKKEKEKQRGLRTKSFIFAGDNYDTRIFGKSFKKIHSFDVSSSRVQCDVYTRAAADGTTAELVYSLTEYG